MCTIRVYPMISTFYRTTVVCILLFSVVPTAVAEEIATTRGAQQGETRTLIQYDRGTKHGVRQFQPAGKCANRPCIVTQHGAIHFTPEASKQYLITMGYIHDGAYRPIEYFQQSTNLEQKFGERILNRTPNRKIIQLTSHVQSGTIDTIYIYGVRLQYGLVEGDPIIISLMHKTNREDEQKYYFRFHHEGVRADIDVSFVFPLNYFHPNPGNAIQGADRGMALSLSMARSMDPERYYGWANKIARAVRLNMFLGVVNRSTLNASSGDQVIENKVDGFGGLGITVFDFLNLGYGINFLRSPRSTFPFIGIEMRHVFEFLQSLKKDTHTQWEQYLEQEKTRATTTPTKAPRKTGRHGNQRQRR